METFKRDAFREATGQDIAFVQDNHSMSSQVGTLRGLHYQSPPHAQDKLVRCVRGAIVDIAVDARKSSPTYGRSVRVELSAENKHQFLVPKGFLHGFVTTEPDTEVEYKVSDIYSPECDGSVSFTSPALGLDWGLPLDAIHLSGKDRDAVAFSDWDSPFD